MFLDPEPKGRQGRSPNTMSGFFSSQRPIEDPRDLSNTIKRKPLHERSQSQNNRQRPGKDSHVPTVRLVKKSPSPSTTPRKTEYQLHEDAEKENTAHDARASYLTKSRAAGSLSPSKPGFSASDQDYGVSDEICPTNKLPKLDLPPAATLQAKNSAYLVPNTAWHRRCTSSGDFSESSTLRDLEYSFGSSSRRSGRFSQGTTLRGTPPPFADLEDPDQDSSRKVRHDTANDQLPTHLLPSVVEASPERSTTQIVSPYPTSQESSDREKDAGSSTSSLEHRHSQILETREVPLQSSERSSLRSQDTFQQFGLRQVPRSQTSKETFAESETAPQSHSPYLLAYDSDASRPRSASYPLHAATSIESIQSRLSRASDRQLWTGPKLSTRTSQASIGPSSSTDTLPPLRVPKKRLRHKQGSLSLGSIAAQGIGAGLTANMVTQEEIDTLPWPRQPFSSHLSTIASESDRQSSRQLSHFSLGSGVLTGDDASSIPLSTWRDKRGESVPMSIDEEPPQQYLPASSHGNDEEPGDMTLGVFRAESAKPEPLFRSNQNGNDGKQYHGPRPPIPPIPRSRDSDEKFDTVSDLSAPALRQQRSGYSLRRRSNSNPSQTHSRGVSQISYNESERGSHGSSLFPVWAKHFYSGTAGLLSASKISLTLPPDARQQQAPTHGRYDSQWTDRSTTSRLGTGYSELDNGSPTSSHFLPSIFRPRTRQRADTEGAENRQSSRFARSRSQTPKAQLPAEPDSRPDSMGIFNDPLPESRQGPNETLPSGQPKWGTLKDKSNEPNLPPLPRKYSKQKLWDDMEYPRAMSRDRISDFKQPHLVPSKRASQSRMSTWQAPSLTESFGSFLRSPSSPQLLLFTCGFVFPPLWIVAALLPLPKKPISAHDLEKMRGTGSEEDVEAAMVRHEAGDAEKRWREERQYLKARWWRCLNRIMSVVGVLVIGAIIALAVVASTR
ncbi:hypothetical protein MBLNU230_g6442t1 [Neophaeotheca triangularis]